MNSTPNYPAFTTAGTDMPGTRSAAWIPRILLGLALVVFLFQAIRWWPFTHDDAWISFRYAENLVRGRGFVFNPGERVEGYTNFLWTVLMSVPIAAGLDPVPVSKILGMLFALATLGVFHQLVRSALPRDSTLPVSWYPSAAVLLLAVSAPFPFWAIGGLETSMFGFLALAGLYLALQEIRSSHGTPSAAGFVLVLAALTRPDGLLFWVLGFIFCAPPFRRWHLQTLINWLVPFVAVYVPYFGWRWLYYGWLLPNTYYVRMGTNSAQAAELFRTGCSYWTSFLMSHGGIPLLVLLAAGILAARFKGKALLLVTLLLWAVHIARAGGDEKPFGRLILPVLPLMILFAVTGINRILKYIRNPRCATWTAIVLTAALVPFVHAGYYNVPDRTYVNDHIFKYCRSSRLLGEWIHTNAAPGDTMAARAIGALGYYGKIPLFDLLGIVDEHIAHLPLQPGQLTAHGKSDLIHILRKQPTYVVFMLMEPEKLGYRRISVDLGPGAPFILFKRDPALVPDPEYMANPRENQGLLMPWKPE